MEKIKVHKSADVSSEAQIGGGTQIWNQSQIREGVTIGPNCIIAKNVYVDFDVKIGSNVKIQNNSSIYRGSVIKSGVFIGPHVCLTNDKYPRAVNPDMTLKSNTDWEICGITVQTGASIGAGCVICPGVEIGSFAMVGAGSVVTKNIPKFALAFGNPAKIVGWVCKCGDKIGDINYQGHYVCKKCKNKECYDTNR